jgi:hypothetical protein
MPGNAKHHRFRIELDDVAAALRAHHDVGSSAAALLDAGTPRAKLVGYVAAPRGNRCFKLKFNDAAADRERKRPTPRETIAPLGSGNLSPHRSSSGTRRRRATARSSRARS